MRRWAWSGPGQAWFSLDLPLAGEAAPPAQHVGPPDAMIASFGNSTLLIRVKFPKLAIMSSRLAVLVPSPHHNAQVNTATTRAHARPSRPPTPPLRHSATPPLRHSATPPLRHSATPPSRQSAGGSRQESQHRCSSRWRLQDRDSATRTRARNVVLNAALRRR